MPLATDTAHLSTHLARQEYVEVYAHHDADGIAAGSILCTALHRLGKGFRLRVTHAVDPTALEEENPVLLCDLGAGLRDLPSGTMVVDHHIPEFEGQFHVNPRLHGIDGEEVLSAAAVAFLVATRMGDNRDLAGLALTGILGDRQGTGGENQAIVNEAIAEGIIVPGRGSLLAGRDDSERLLLATDPYLPGLSGDEAAVREVLALSEGGEGPDPAILNSRIVLGIAANASIRAMEGLWGDRYELLREVVPDALTLAALIGACGKEGKGGLAASLCMRNGTGADEAWEVFRHHRFTVIEELKQALAGVEAEGIVTVSDPGVTGEVADVLARDLPRKGPVAVVATTGTLCRVSVRTPPGDDADLGIVVRGIAETCGGRGGGHRHRAGATIPLSGMDTFREAWKREVAA